MSASFQLLRQIASLRCNKEAVNYNLLAAGIKIEEAASASGRRPRIVLSALIDVHRHLQMGHCLMGLSAAKVRS